MASETDRALARLHLDLAQALYTQREALGLTVEQLRTAAGLAAERIIAIEEGDTSSLTDVARLCRALDVELRLDAGFSVQLIPLHKPSVRWIKGPSESEAKSTGFAHSTVDASANPRGAFDQPATVGQTSPVSIYAHH